jgi:hypothetical protein
MKNIQLMLVSIIANLVFVNLVFAEALGWTGEREVVEIVTVINGGINVRLSPELSGCVSQSGYGDKYASIYPEHLGKNMFQANLLAAMMSGKKVSLYLVDNQCKVYEMRIHK